MVFIVIHNRLHIDFSKSELCLSQYVWLFWYIKDMSVFLPTDKFFEIQQLVLSLLQVQTATAHLVMSIWTSPTFVTMGMYNFTIYVVWTNNMFISIILFHTYFVLFNFLFSALHQLQRLSHVQHCPVSLLYPFHDVVITIDALFCHWVFYVQASALPLSFCRTWVGCQCNVHISSWNL